MEAYRLSVVILAVDETYSLRNTFNKLAAADAACEYLFMLSRNCTPACLAVVEDICKRPDCRYIIQSGDGLGYAIREAIQAVRGTHIVIWTGDGGGADPAVFPEMVRLSHKYSEKIISTSRWLQKGSFHGYNPIRKVVNFLSQKMFSALFKSDLTDFTNIIQIAPITAYRGIKLQENGFTIIPELQFKLVKLGRQFLEIPCIDNTRQEGRSHAPFRELADYYRVILKIHCMDMSDIIADAQS
ncbi:MAG: glycosyltransferase [Clostridia bacterium]|nr:glycosyltransferase [Clostridia bacterium]